MEVNKEEALKAIQIAEKRFSQRDFTGAQSYALKAKALYPGLEGISQIIAIFEVYSASETTFNGESDYYSILGLKPSADRETVKRHYKKMAVMLHPDKNKCIGADGAFKLVSEAWNLLSDNAKRSSYDLRRSQQFDAGFSQTDLSSVHATGYNTCSNSWTTHVRRDTFWTICTSCKVQYEYVRKYVSKRLSCKNCRGTFVALETGAPPANGSFPYSSWPYIPSNGYQSHSYDRVTYVPSNSKFYNGNGIPGYNSRHGYEYVSNVSFQWNSSSGTSVGVIGQNGLTGMTVDSVDLSKGGIKRRGRGMVIPGANKNPSVIETTVPPNSSVTVSFDLNAPQETKPCWPDKRRKIVVGATFRNGSDEKGPKSATQVVLVTGNTGADSNQKPSSATEVQNKQFPSPPAFDARKMLIEKARTEIRQKLEEMKFAAETVAAAVVKEKEKAIAEQSEVAQWKREVSGKPGASSQQLEPKKTTPISITVPDPDFHDFDSDRLEECFKPKQIWALYDEEDGMPRLYCLVREVMSVKPFKILISYLSSKSDTELGWVNWPNSGPSGFTKSCGHFMACNSDGVDQVNIFSHVLIREKAGRGGCIHIYPRSGDIWAVYRNWSPDWDSSTPNEVRHHYEMVEVLDDYSEECGICVAPLIKLAGYKTVYCRIAYKTAIRRIPKKEMLRFSHQVPSWLLTKDVSNLPERCWDLDPAATPDELLHSYTEEMAS